MNSKDWADLARVYRAGVRSYKRYGVPTSGFIHAAAHEAMAQECEEISRKRAALERKAMRGGAS
jgi:hypothetical protein